MFHALRLSIECCLRSAGVFLYWHQALQEYKQPISHTSHLKSTSVANLPPLLTSPSQYSTTLQIYTLNTGSAVPAAWLAPSIIRPDVLLIVMASVASRHPAVTASSMGRFMKHVSVCMFACVCDVLTVKNFSSCFPSKLSNPWDASVNRVQCAVLS